MEDDGRDLLARAFTLDEEVIIRGITTAGVIHIFSDSRHSTLEISEGGYSRNTADHARGKPVSNDLGQEIEAALASPYTIGVAGTSKMVYEYLRRDGEVDDANRIYRKENRTYYLF